MWSDRTPPEKLRALVAGLHSVLPAPRASALTCKRTVPSAATVEQVAGLLHDEPGFTLLGGSQLLRRPLATVWYSDGAAAVTGPQGTVGLRGGAFEILDAMLAAWSGPEGALLAGFLSYDLAAELEDLGEMPPATYVFPGFHFALYDASLTFENAAWNIQTTDAWRTPPEDILDLLTLAEGVIVGPPSSNASPGTLSSRPDRNEFEAAVERTIRTIHAGDIFQTNLCRCINAGIMPGAAWDLFRRMRAISPARYEAFFSIEPEWSRALLSISPEQFLKLDHGVVESSPIKGTRPRGRNAAEDRALSD